MFASKGLAEHLARGAIGIGAFVCSGVLATTHPVLSLLALPVALIALRGCPMCWTIGLVQTIVAKVRGRPRDSFCTDGRCR